MLVSVFVIVTTRIKQVNPRRRTLKRRRIVGACLMSKTVHFLPFRNILMLCYVITPLNHFRSKNKIKILYKAMWLWVRNNWYVLCFHHMYFRSETGGVCNLKD